MVPTVPLKVLVAMADLRLWCVLRLLQRVGVDDSNWVDWTDLVGIGLSGVLECWENGAC